ncbi:hypothetical protein BCR44DRAFT_402529 [Catenaria anguillulae PL171]|uniref:Uncharacterized protein n=1 Tax=Catenaria anguillulae PL171 TaxID=765915 RepID=A0A1Y2HN56_9FUNG|nr:hypothetical protein BCR44DRAFT_402529 [Catenaria anguillulae PL171]
MSPITSESFAWSGSAFFLGPNLIWLIHATLSSWTLFRRSKRSYYYLAMSCIAILRLLGISINCFGANLPDMNDASNWLVVQSIVEWPASIGFSFLNAYRLQKVARTWSPRLVRASNLLMAVNMVTFNAAMGAYTYSTIARLAVNRANFWFAFANMYDAVLNCYISGVFLLYLRAKGLQTGPTTPKGSWRSRIGLLPHQNRAGNHTRDDEEDKKGGMRQGLKSLIQEDTILIPAECLAVIAGNALQVISQELDPMWSTFYAAEAFRLYAFTKFLTTLNRIMLQNNNTVVPRRH